MSHTSSASFRDPENAAFHLDGGWYRIAEPASADALRALRSSGIYDELISAGSLVSFDEVVGDERERVLSAFHESALRDVSPEAAVFQVATIELITYPWEWPNSLLRSAGLLTLELRLRLLGIGLDLKDASAFNVQFRGMRPVFVDLGSIQRWRPNPSWNASRQFIEHFINPLAVGSGERVTAADAWNLGGRRGLRSESARQLVPGKQRRSLSLLLLQATTRPVAKNAPSETTFAGEAAKNPGLALNATRSLTGRLRKQLDRLAPRHHATTWVDYGSREHYASDDLDRKSAYAADFIRGGADRGRLVLDVGGNDGFTAAHLARNADATVVVMDADAGALDVLYDGMSGQPDLVERVTPLLGDVTNLTPASGLLDREYAAFVGRVRPSAAICQAVLHHVVITQGTPMRLAVEALAAFGCPVQIEFATEDDEKVRLLLRQIPNWTGTYSTAALLDALRSTFAHVSEVGTTSATRVVVNAWND